LALVAFCDARPGIPILDDVHATLYDRVDSQIIGGINAAQGAWPWQLSQQRLGGSWSHSCGASLIKSRYGLSAAHCVEGAAVGSIRCIAGQHDRSNMAGTQTLNTQSLKMHEQYNNGQASYANDIAIITFPSPANIGGSVQNAILPANNNNDFAGANCVITGWGRTSASNTLPNVLQQATVGILSNQQCVSAVGNNVWSNHICIKDSQNTRGACNGDSGGPCNCPNGASYLVVGITSFVYQSNGNCLPTYPSVYTRVGAYLGWISVNTP